MATMNLEKSSEYLEIHYCFNDDSHSMDAELHNKCSAEVIFILKEISKILEVNISVDVEPIREGGLRDDFFVVATGVTLFLGVVQLYFTTHPVSSSIQKENDQLENEKLKLEIRKLKQGLKEIDDSSNKAISIQQHKKLEQSKSNFFKGINSYHKINEIEFNLLDSRKKLIDGKSKKIIRNDFSKYILAEEIEDPIKIEWDHEAEIQIISPVLTKDDYSWQGKYKDRVIKFTMSDPDFKREVLAKKYKFKSRDTIVTQLKIFINDVEGSTNKPKYEAAVVFKYNRQIINDKWHYRPKTNKIPNAKKQKEEQLSFLDILDKK
jgi:hypothetical protein